MKTLIETIRLFALLAILSLAIVGVAVFVLGTEQTTPNQLTPEP